MRIGYCKRRLVVAAVLRFDFERAARRSRDRRRDGHCAVRLCYRHRQRVARIPRDVAVRIPARGERLLGAVVIFSNGGSRPETRHG